MLPQVDKEAPLVDREVRKYQQRLAQFEKLQAQKEKRKKAVEDKQERLKQKQKDMCTFRTTDAAWLNHLPEAPTYYPTLEEFEDPIAYIRKIQHEAVKWGICKIVPPIVPAIPGSMVLNGVEGKRFTFTTRQQYVRDAPWQAFEEAKFYQGGKKYTVGEYEKFADDFCRKRFGTAGVLPARLVEAEYWREMSADNPTIVEYGNDVEGSAFCDYSEDPLSGTRWNLQVLPKDDLSVLRLLKGDVPGVTSPMLYIGMLFATFAWHVEDHYLYSINYQHLGASKVWYGVPGKDADAFEKVAEDEVYANALEVETKNGATASELLNSVHSTLLGKTTMFSPRRLIERGVTVCRAVQAPGEFVVTFPRSYHAGFSLGFNVGEAVNFAIGDWFPFGQNASKRYSRLSRLPVLPHEQLLCSEAVLLGERGCTTTCRPDNDATAAAENTVKQCFVGLVRTQHRKRGQMVARGARTQYMPAFTSSFPCSVCRDMCYLAAVVCEECEDPKCLSCALAEESCGGHATVLIRRDLLQLENLCRTFEGQLQDSKELRSTLGTDGLSPLDFDLCDELQEIDVFEWSELPLPTTGVDGELDVLDTADAIDDLLGPAGNLLSAVAVSISERSVRVDVAEDPNVNTATTVDSFAANTQSTSKLPEDDTRTTSEPGDNAGSHWRLGDAKPVNDYQAEISNFGFAEAHVVKQEQEVSNKVARGRGNVRISKPASASPPVVMLPAVGKRKRAAALKLLSEFQKGTYEDFDGAEADVPRETEELSGDRFTDNWSNITAESFELKEEDTVVRKRKRTSPGAKQAHPPGTRLPGLVPARALNGPKTPLVCVDDSMVNVAPSGKPELLLRRRIYASSESSMDRYLIASEVVKGSGYQTTTSASNVIDRWFKDAAINAEKFGLPQPGLPFRAYCKGVNSPSGQGCYVISAQDVLLIGWVLQVDLKERLRRYTMGVWPQNADPLSRLEALMTQAVGFSKENQQRMAQNTFVPAHGMPTLDGVPNYNGTQASLPRRAGGRGQAELSKGMHLNQGPVHMPAVVGLTSNGQPINTEMLQRYIMQKQGQLTPQQVNNLLMVMQRLRACEHRQALEQQQAYYSAMSDMPAPPVSMRKNGLQANHSSLPRGQRRSSSVQVQPSRRSAGQEEMDLEQHMPEDFSVMGFDPGQTGMYDAASSGMALEYQLGPRRRGGSFSTGNLRKSSANQMLESDDTDPFVDDGSMIKREHGHDHVMPHRRQLPADDEFEWNGQLGFMDSNQDW